MERKKNYKFTNKKHSERGIMSVILGLISLISVFIALYQSYRLDGQVGFNYGIVGFIITCFALIGLVLGFLAKSEADRYLLFAYLGIGVNIAALLCVSMILYAGAYGIG
jgi:hypothetical protein